MLGCDNSSALSLAFEGDRPLSLHTPDFDVLYAIRHNIQSSLISWSPTHVKGHQDEQVAVSDLPRLAQLNCEMDALAKGTLRWILVVPSSKRINRVPWTIWKGPSKIVHNWQTELYDFAHGEAAQCS
jgi:hypothetical protein